MRNMEAVLKLKAKLQSGHSITGTMMEQLQGPKLVKVLEEAGFDFVFIDCEHGTYSYDSVSDMIIAADFSRMIPLVRIAEIRKEAIIKILDAGVGGIMIPTIKSAEEAQRAIELAKFKPLGNRGYSLFKYYNNYSAAHPAVVLEKTNQALFIVMQIETTEAVGCIDEIASVEGVDALLVGPGDLSLSLGFPGEPRHPAVVSAIDKVIAAGRKNGITTGIHCAALEDLRFWKEKGMQMLSWSSPMAMIYHASRHVVDSLKGSESLQ